MKIGVVGGGSIGLLLSCYLCVNHEVNVYVRRKTQKERINESGLIANNSESFPVKSLLIDEMEVEDLLIICVKANQVSEVLPIIRKTNKQTALLFLQNGMGHIESIKKLNQLIYLGVVEHGAIRKEDNCVVHTGQGVIKVALYNGDNQELCDLVRCLNQPNFPVLSHISWQQLLMRKLIVNAVINPITALFGVKNGQILKNIYLRSIAKELCKETASILQLDFNEQWENVQAIANKTSENISSMLSDINKNQQTEIEAISGYILGLNEATKPYTQFVYHGIKALEIKKG